MIFQRSLIRELTQVAMAVFTVLLAIVLTTQVLKLFGRAAAGQLASDAIFAMVGFATLGSFGVVLSLTLFISIMIVLTRLHRDSEMAVWQTSGLSPTAWISPVLKSAVS
jgi:lipopolysaccharide export system permease protein